MSLINKVLLDLDNRTQNGGATFASRSLFSNLHPVGVPSSISLPQWLWALCAGLVVFGGLVGGGWYYRSGARAAPAELVANRTTVTSQNAQNTDTPAKTAIAPKPAPPPPVAQAEAKPAPPPRESTVPEPAHATSSAPSEMREAAIVSPPVEQPPVRDTTATPAPPPPVAEAKPAPKEESSLERTARPLSPGEKAENLFRKGVSLYRAGQEKEGERALQAALTIDPTHTAARETLTVVLLENHRFEEAKHILSEGIALVPNYAPFSSRLARLYVEQGDEARALSLLESNRARATPDAAYLGLLGTLYQRASKPEEARDAFRQALRLQPDEGRWWMGLGISLEGLRDWAAARDAYQHCLVSNQTEARVHQYAEQRLTIVSRHIP